MENSSTMALGSITTSRWYCIKASPFNRSSVMVLRIGVLINLSMLIDRSHSQLVTGSVAISFMSMEMLGK